MSSVKMLCPAAVPLSAQGMQYRDEHQDPGVHVSTDRCVAASERCLITQMCLSLSFTRGRLSVCAVANAIIVPEYASSVH
jgi:hypothetical protein